MPKRMRMSRSKSKRDFRRKADRVHRKNLVTFTGPMRGGIRL